MKALERNKALVLRKKGWSEKEISGELGVSKSTVSLWVRNLKLSDKAKKILSKKFSLGQIKSQEAHRNITKQKVEAAEDFANEILIDYKNSNTTTLILCSLIYYCEGTKSMYQPVYFTNSDPLLLCLFLKLFRSSFNLNERKFRVCVHLHNYHNIRDQLNFWSKTLTIPRSQFSKPYLKKNSGVYKKEGYRGCVSLRYYDNDIARRLNIVAKAFMKMGL